MSMSSMEGEHDDKVHAALLEAGEAGLTLRELEAVTGIRYRVLHNVTWRLEQQSRARRVDRSRPIRYVATRSVGMRPAIPLPTREQQTSRRTVQTGSTVGRAGSAEWRPHPDGDARRASAVRLAAAVLAADGLTNAHRREALALATWLYTEADGKWNTSYRSVALSVRNGRISTTSTL
jgi:hypothetical protein